MVTPRNYAKLCDAGRLTQELIAAGIPQSPTGGFKMFGVSVDSTGPTTTVWVIDTLLAADGTTIDNTVTAHVNTPLNTPPSTQNFVMNGRLTWVSVTQVTLGTAAIVSRARDSTDVFDITWSGALTGDITLSGAGGLDTGAPAANTWYAVHIIADSRGVNTPRVLLSLSPTAPTMPAGWDKFRRMGWVRRNGSNNFLKTVQIGNGYVRKHYYDEASSSLNVLTAGSATVFTGVSLATVAPPTVREVSLRVNLKNTGGLATDDLKLRPTGSTQATPINTLQAGILLTDFLKGQMDMVCDTNQSIDYIVANALDVAKIGVAAYTDEI